MTDKLNNRAISTVPRRDTTANLLAHVGELYPGELVYSTDDRMLGIRQITNAIIDFFGGVVPPPADIIPVNPTVTPHVGGGQVSATQLNYGFTSVMPAASSNDSVALPAAVAGSIVVLFTYGDSGVANSTNFIGIYAKNGTTDMINTNLNAVEYSWQPYFASVYGQSQLLIAICVVDGTWITNSNVS